MTDFKILNSIHLDRLHHNYFNTTTTQQEHKSGQEKVCFIIYALNDFIIKHFKEVSQKAIDKRILNLKEALHENTYPQNNISKKIFFPKPICRLP